MKVDKAELAELGLTRTGRRSGCSCCSFTMMGLMALPLLGTILFFLAR